MQVNNIKNMAIQAISLISGASLAGITANVLVKTLGLEKVDDKESNLSDNVEVSNEDFNAIKNELENLKTELAELKDAQTETKTSEQSLLGKTQTSTADATVVDTTTTNQTEDIQTDQTITKTTLKKIDISNLTQSEANQIWISYLKDDCEYDLNDNNINEFCTKFGFDINYAKN